VSIDLVDVQAVLLLNQVLEFLQRAAQNKAPSSPTNRPCAASSK
jgi:hypothetical protein